MKNTRPKMKANMSKLIVVFATIAASLEVPTIVQAAQEKPVMQNTTPEPSKSGYAAVNGVNYYYAIYDTGEPLLLLHGGMFHIEMFGPNLTKLARSRQVIGVDLQGHGRTPLGDREISLVDIGNDMAGVLKKLGYDKADVLGYSMGGGVALQFAIRHPEMVRRLVLVSTPFSQEGFYPEMLPQQAALSAAMAEQMKETSIYKSYVAIAPHPEEFPKLLDQMGAYMRKPLRLVGGRQETDDAGDAYLWRQRHVSAGARGEVLPTARRGTEGCGLAARAYVAESPGDSAEPHTLRNGHRGGAGRYCSAAPEWRRRAKRWDEPVTMLLGRAHPHTATTTTA